MDIISHTEDYTPAMNNPVVAAGEEKNRDTTTTEDDLCRHQIDAPAEAVVVVEEAEEEKDENEEESWAMGLANADLQEGALEPILEASIPRPRIGKGVLFLVLIDAEWELVRFHKSVNTVYQLFNVITNEWYESSLDSNNYGRMSQSSSRWIQFKSTACR